MELLVVLGATATGKSALALRLAEELDGELINVDALQIYRGLDIGTAKPTREERERVPHHLVDIVDPIDHMSAGELARRARVAADEIADRVRLPIVVGGSGLYLRALLGGISSIPDVDARLRNWLRDAHARAGLPALRRWLRVLDPEAAARTTEGDTQRTLRALELALGSGRPQHAWIARQPFSAQHLPALRVGLTVPRAVLYDRIAGRVTAMIASGWVEEVEALLAAGWDSAAPAFQAIGYRQIVRHLRGELSLEQAIDDIIRATRRFAKRQLTWFRTEPDVAWFQADDAGATVTQVLAFLKNRGVGRGHGEARNQHPGRLSLPEPQGGS